MKQIFQFLLNVLIYLLHVIAGFFLMLWYGKLPKVSVYHMERGVKFSIKDIFEDPYIQGRWYHPDDIRRMYYRECLNQLHHLPELKKDVPIYDDEHKRIGTQTLWSKLREEIDKL